MLHGPAYLEVGGKVVKLRRKGLALLYYLALEGPTRRESLADVLWGHGDALRNLRVELHRIKESLESLGLEPFANGGDPLRLTDIELNRSPTSGTVLEGMDDISPEYQEWLERQRAMAADGTRGNARADQIADLAKRVAAPFVLVLRGEPGSGRRLMAQELATALGMTFIDGCSGTAAGLRYVVPDDETCANVATRIAEDKKNVWVIESSVFGEDDDLLLRVRAAIRPDRLRFVALDPLSWWAAKRMLPSEMLFAERARLFLASGGNQAYLTELLKLRDIVEPGAPLPVPLRVRAAFALETRRLSESARRSLESASIYQGPLSRALLDAVGCSETLDELERTGWLTFEDAGWRFTSEISRRMLEGQMREGIKRRLHAEAAVALERQGSTAAAAYHRARSNGTWPSSVANHASSKDPAAAATPVAVGREFWLDETEIVGSFAQMEGNKVTLARTTSDRADSFVAIRLPEEPLLLRVRGRSCLEATPPTDVGDESSPLRMTLSAAGAREVRFVTDDEVAVGADGELRLPIGERFGYWLLTPTSAELRFQAAPGAVIEFKVNAYRPLPAGNTTATSDAVIEAYQLERALNERVSDSVPVSKPRKGAQDGDQHAVLS